MDTIELGGVTYFKLTVLAKKYGYTTDYIGQLCRNNTLDAKLVGRAWYATESSLKSHRTGRYHRSTPDDVPKKADNKFKNESHVIPVTPRLSKRVHRQELDDIAKQRISELHAGVQYEVDTADLAPKPVKSTQSAVAGTVPLVRHISVTKSVEARKSTELHSTLTIAHADASEAVHDTSDFDSAFIAVSTGSQRGAVRVESVRNIDMENAEHKPMRRIKPKFPNRYYVPVTEFVGAPSINGITQTGDAKSAVRFTPTAMLTARNWHRHTGLIVGALVFVSCTLFILMGSLSVVEGQDMVSSWYLQLTPVRELFEFYRGY